MTYKYVIYLLYTSLIQVWHENIVDVNKTLIKQYFIILSINQQGESIINVFLFFKIILYFRFFFLLTKKQLNWKRRKYTALVIMKIIKSIHI